MSLHCSMLVFLLPSNSAQLILIRYPCMDLDTTPRVKTTYFHVGCNPQCNVVFCNLRLPVVDKVDVTILFKMENPHAHCSGNLREVLSCVM